MASPRLHGNLPDEVTSFVGRRRELDAVNRALPGTRMLTLTGPGGVGKTRLALRVAGQVERAFPDGVWLVELAALRDPALLDRAVADAVGLRDQSARSSREALATYLRDKRLLLVLDNCEHLGDECAILTAGLLSASPKLRILATSRKALNVRGEHILPVPPLPVPGLNLASPGEPDANEAVRLFGERAAAVAPGFAVTKASQEAVVRICQRLDGLPLAIELAAAWARTLPLQQILDRLEDRFRLLTGGSPAVLPRHQTLRAVVDSSYELCSPAERRLWVRVSVFAGGFTLDAAEEVCAGEGIERGEVLDVVAGLVDKSILTRDEQGWNARARYQVLDIIRHYGADRLRAMGEQDVWQRRHRDYFLGMAEQGEAGWFGPGQLAIAARIRGEHANLRLALEYCLSTPGESQTGLRMASALYFYWMGCGFVAEGRRWLGRALAVDATPSRARAGALWTTAQLTAIQGDNHAVAIDLATQCREWAGSRDDQTMLAYALAALGGATGAAGDLPRSRVLLEDALARFAGQNELNSTVIFTFVVLSEILTAQGELEYAIALGERAVELCEKHGERWGRAFALFSTVLPQWRRGERQRALTHARDGLHDVHALDDLLGTVQFVERLAWLAAADGEGERAAVLLGVTSRLWPLLGGQSLFDFRPYVAAHEECARQARRILGEHGFQAAFDRGAAFDRDQAIAYALGEPAPSAPEAPAAGADPLAVLTQRERQVGELITQGLSSKDIAARLVIARRTAEAHVENMLTKLGFTKRAQLAAWYTEQRQGRARPSPAERKPD